MKGAIAEPWLSTIRAPNTARTIITGSNQNFFLILRKLHSSEMNESILLVRFAILKLIIHGVRGFTTLDPIGLHV